MYGRAAAKCQSGESRTECRSDPAGHAGPIPGLGAWQPALRDGPPEGPLIPLPAHRALAGLPQHVADEVARLRPWMAWADVYTPEMARGFVDRNAARPGNPPVPEVSYVVCDRSGGLLGVCGLHARLGPNALEIGYWVDVRHTRRGVATLATGALTELAMGIAEVEVVEIHHDQANSRSGAVPARLGYELATTVNDEPEAPGEVGIELQWRMTRAAWPTSAGARLLAEARAAAP
ncbi:MAG: GNAT family N-acetyltransferase [Mycobacteriales bacterium]